MAITIDSWPISEAGALSNLWAASTIDAPYAFPVTSDEFADRIRPVSEDEESYATDHAQQLLVALDGGSPIGFAHIGADDAIKIDGEDVACGIVRFLAFPPNRPDAGQALLDRSHEIFLNEGLEHADAFPIYHGYAFHNFKVGILSDRMAHVGSLLTENGYLPHDPQLTFERPIRDEAQPDERDDLDIVIEKTDGEGIRPDIRVWAVVDGKRVGNCRTMSGRRYAGLEELERCAYTRWLGVSEPYRRRGIGRYLLRRALYEFEQEGYEVARLNARESNTPALAIYHSEGYVVGDRSCAWLKDLGE